MKNSKNYITELSFFDLNKKNVKEYRIIDKEKLEQWFYDPSFEYFELNIKKINSLNLILKCILSIFFIYVLF